MDKNNLLKTAFIIGILLLVVGDVVAQATKVMDNINCIACRVAYILIGVVGIIAGIIMVMSAVKWVSSPDDPAARGAARLTIIHTIVGLALVVISVFLVQYVTTGLLTAPGGTQPDIGGWFDGCATECPK